jgi:hypothetical protein
VRISYKIVGVAGIGPILPLLKGPIDVRVTGMQLISYLAVDLDVQSTIESRGGMRYVVGYALQLPTSLKRFLAGLQKEETQGPVGRRGKRFDLGMGPAQRAEMIAACRKYFLLQAAACKFIYHMCEVDGVARRFVSIRKAMSKLTSLLQSPDRQVLTMASLALSSLTRYGAVRRRFVAAKGYLAQLMNLANEPKAAADPAISRFLSLILANITESGQHNKALLRSGALRPLLLMARNAAFPDNQTCILFSIASLAKNMALGSIGDAGSHRGGGGGGGESESESESESEDEDELDQSKGNDGMPVLVAGAGTGAGGRANKVAPAGSKYAASGQHKGGSSHAGGHGRLRRFFRRNTSKGQFYDVTRLERLDAAYNRKFPGLERPEIRYTTEILDLCCDLMEDDSNPDLQLGSATIILNLVDRPSSKKCRRINQRAVVQFQRVLPSLIRLAGKPIAEFRNACGVAIAQLALSNDAHDVIIKNGGMAALLDLAKSGNEELQVQCAQAFTRLSITVKKQAILEEGMYDALEALEDSTNNAIKNLAHSSMMSLFPTKRS